MFIMQQTRQVILEVLHERGQATVDELVRALVERIQHDITAVTVRHHLEILRGEGLVSPPMIKHRNTPGRPQHVFVLTEKALEHFPSNYQSLAANLLEQIKATLPDSQVEVLLNQLADQMAHSAGVSGLPIETRLNKAVAYLNEQGYDAEWSSSAEGYVLHTRNCPYRKIVGNHNELCGMDNRLISELVGVKTQCVGRLSEGNPSCEYIIPLEKVS